MYFRGEKDIVEILSIIDVLLHWHKILSVKLTLTENILHTTVHPMIELLSFDRKISVICRNVA